MAPFFSIGVTTYDSVVSFPLFEKANRESIATKTMDIQFLILLCLFSTLSIFKTCDAIVGVIVIDNTKEATNANAAAIGICLMAAPSSPPIIAMGINALTVVNVEEKIAAATIHVASLTVS